MIDTCLAVLIVTLLSFLSDPVPRVLDLGVTRMLVRRLVRVFSHACKGHKPKLSSTAACRVCNRRFEEMGRRCKAKKDAPGCVSLLLASTFVFRAAPALQRPHAS